jgi:hypothetical protein
VPREIEGALPMRPARGAAQHRRMDIRRIHLPTAAAIAATVALALPALATSTQLTAGTEGAAEHAGIAQRILISSLIRNVGREGAAEHAGLR